MRNGLIVSVLLAALRAVEDELIKFTLIQRWYLVGGFVLLTTFWVRTRFIINQFSAGLTDKLKAFTAASGWMDHVLANLTD